MISKQKDAQASTEFLFTYGSMILVVLIVGSLIFYFMDFSGLQINRVSFKETVQGISQNSFAVSKTDTNPGVVVVTFSYIAETRKMIPAQDNSIITLGGGNCNSVYILNHNTQDQSGEEGVYFLNGQLGSIAFICEDGALVENDRLLGTVELISIDPRLNINRPQKGEINLKVTSGESADLSFVPDQYLGFSIVFDFMDGVMPPNSTLSRASIGTYFDSDGSLKIASDDEPRFNYISSGDVYSLEGLYVEPQRTNYVLNSNDFLDSYWTTLRVAISQEANSKFEEIYSLSRTSSGTSFIGRTPNAIVTSGTGPEIVRSVYAKRIYENTSDTSVFSLRNGEYGGTTYRGISLELQDFDAFTLGTNEGPETLLGGGTDFIGDGWYRIWFADDNSGRRRYAVRANSGPLNTELFYITSAQAESADSPSSYIPTDGSSVTREEDTLTLNGIDLGSYDIYITRASGVEFLENITISSGSYVVPTNLSPLQKVRFRKLGE